jgi:hypothetical protein
MATGLRKSGISFMGNMPWGAHFCSFYETKQDLLDTLVPYFAAGLANQEFCLWVLTEDVTEIVLCSFPLAGGEVVDTLDAARIHQLAVARRHGAWEMVEPPELQQAWTKIKRLNEETEQRVVERMRELAAVNEALTREIVLLHFNAGADLKNAIGR